VAEHLIVVGAGNGAIAVRPRRSLLDAGAGSNRVQG
jgi:hypothetical protein